MNVALRILCAGALFAAAEGTHADDRSFEERLLRPDMTRDPNLGGRDFKKSSSPFGREFQGGKAFSTGSFDASRQEPRRFLGIPIPWFGNKKVETKSFAGADREFVTRMAKAFEKDNSSLGSKSFADGSRAAYADAGEFPARKATIVGKDQKNLDSQNQELSVDEVRELLNKR